MIHMELWMLCVLDVLKSISKLYLPYRFNKKTCSVNELYVNSEDVFFYHFMIMLCFLQLESNGEESNKKTTEIMDVNI